MSASGRGTRAQVALFAGSRTGATELGHARTDAAGAFTISYTKPAAGVLYVQAAAAGGSRLQLRAVAGVGRGGGVPPQTLTTVTVNELTTVATAYALAQFTGANGISGPSPGLENAAATAFNLADSATGKPGAVVSDSDNGAKNATLATLGTLANLVSVCSAQHDIGWMAYDANRQSLATYYFARALRFSHAAENRLLGGRILAAMSHQAIYLGHIREALDFARAARCGTLHLATPRAAAMLAAMEACAHAAAGNARPCRAALDDAEHALAQAPGGPDPDWLDFDEGGYLGHAARAYRDLGEPKKAEQLAEKSVARCLAGHSRTRAQRSAIQATAYLRLGEVDAAADVGQRIVAEAWNLHSGHVFGEIAELVEAVEPFKASAAESFLEQARELLASRIPTAAS
jgi:hypothetical protein